jgi:2-polyprenyl-3-methyl-5-hydroxy-6-metoxy-1,4-benzoquinol methylase
VKRLVPETTWPESWKQSYSYDLEEVYGVDRQSGYALAYQNRRQVTLDLITSALAPGARVLDVAAAQGNFSLTLAEMGYDVTWNDLRAELADYVRLKHERGTIRYAPGNAFDLAADAVYDGIVMTEVIEHVAHPDELLARAACLLRPGGCIVLTTPNGAYFRNRLPRFTDCPDPAVYESVQFKPNADGHIFLLHPDEMATLARRAGMRIERLVLFTNPLTHGHLRTASLVRVLPAGLVDVLESASRKLPPPLGKRCLIQMAARLRKPATASA